MTMEPPIAVDEVDGVCGAEPDTRLLVRDLFTMTGDRWSMAVFSALASGPVRFGRILSSVDGISHRMLTRTLRSLERDGLVSRTAYAESPPRVEYELTELGQTLRAPVATFVWWTHEHRVQIEESRRRFDG